MKWGAGVNFTGIYRLGETVLYVNNIESRRYKVNDLTKKDDDYELNIRLKDFENNFIAGENNLITVKAFMPSSSVSSKGFYANYRDVRQPKGKPDLYCLTIGINKYKGEKNLRYPETDAIEMSQIIRASARKLLNIDSTEHVHIFNVTTSRGKLFPDKETIRQILQDSIGKRAKSNDILLMFFSGHGEMVDGQFEFITAESSSLSRAGITSNELFDWTKPDILKAQKRVLIIDACHSGQLLQDLAINNNEITAYVSKDVNPVEQVKAIDRLNERSGMFIISASASDQFASENSQYGHGVLTYALLKSIKENPGILEEGSKLNVSSWFNSAQSIVSDLVQKSPEIIPYRQDPKIYGIGNFFIGYVDETVTKGINFQTKPLFTSSNFQDLSLAIDNLEFSSILNQELQKISLNPANNTLIFKPVSEPGTAFTLSGRYKVRANDVVINAYLTSRNAVNNFFTVTGKKNDLTVLARNIIQIALLRIEKNKSH